MVAQSLQIHAKRECSRHDGEPDIDEEPGRQASGTRLKKMPLTADNRTILLIPDCHINARKTGMRSRIRLISGKTGI
jgi:hypothetical protein